MGHSRVGGRLLEGDEARRVSHGGRCAEREARDGRVSDRAVPDVPDDVQHRSRSTTPRRGRRRSSTTTASSIATSAAAPCRRTPTSSSGCWRCSTRRRSVDDRGAAHAHARRDRPRRRLPVAAQRRRQRRVQRPVVDAPVRRRCEPAATVAGLRGLAHYAALAQDDEPEKADRAFRRARLSEQWLIANAPDAYPPSLRAAVSYDFYAHSATTRSLERCGGVAAGRRWRVRSADDGPPQRRRAAALRGDVPHVARPAAAPGPRLLGGGCGARRRRSTRT